jgi:hypothetical protein
MLIPIGILTGLLRTFLGGPLSKIIDSYIGDLELRRKIKAELDHALLEDFGTLITAQRDAVIAEVTSESWLTRSWRPLLMVVLMGFLILCGLFLPCAELLLSHRIAFRPRWDLLPPQLWDLIYIGIGGYVGGRSIEKIAATVTGSQGPGTVKRR